MKKTLITGAVFILIIASGYLYMTTWRVGLSQEEATTEQRIGEPTFSWSYRSFERDYIPYTEISLTAGYASSTPVTKIIDTVEGDCNAYETLDSDVYEGSTMVICYYAGLGRYFKVVPGEGEYLVQRKIFEEASPDYDPPVQGYETVARF